MPVVQCSSIDNIVWGKLPPGPCHLSGNIHIWRTQLSSHLHTIDDLELFLSSDEVVRAHSYIQEKDRQRFIISRSMLRSVLAGYMNEPPEKVQFIIGDNRKPILHSKHPELHYNIAHSGNWMVIAVSNTPVGIDIEHINPSFDHTEVLPVCFSNDEASSIQNNERFYLLWTRKESLVKATGKGLDDDLPFVPCMDGQHSVSSEKIGSDKDWSIHSFDIADGYISSFAHDPNITDLSFFDC